MPRIKKQEEQQLCAYFTATGFVMEEDLLELQDPLKTWLMEFKADKYAALFHLGFLERAKWFSPSLEYLHHIAELLIGKITQQADLEISRDAVQVDLRNDEVERLKVEIPFVIGINWKIRFKPLTR